ncbi:hypothetical protein D3C71_883380 [compost metagenome]
MSVAPLRLTLSVPEPAMLPTLTLTDVPELADTLTILPLALPVPTSVKSSVDTFDTVSSKVTVNAIAASLAAGDPTGAMLLTEAMRLSTVALLASAVVVVLPALSVAVKVTLRLLTPLMAPPTIV